MRLFRCWCSALTGRRANSAREEGNPCRPEMLCWGPHGGPAELALHVSHFVHVHVADLCICLLSGYAALNLCR